MNGAAARLAALLFVLLCAGCATPTDAEFDPALFVRPPVAAEHRVPGRVALWMPPEVTRTVETKTLFEKAPVPIGHYVEAAMRAAVNDAVQGGAEVLQAAPTPGSGFDAILLVEAVRLDVQEKFEAEPDPLLPFLRPPTRVTRGRLAFDLSLLDAQGRRRWTRSYDTGRELWYPPVVWAMAPAPWVGLPATYNIVRRGHQAAWRLAQQAAAEVRDWLTAERTRPRDL